MTYADLADHLAAKHGANDLVLSMMAKVKAGKIGSADMLLFRSAITVDSAVLTLRRMPPKGRVLKAVYASEDMAREVKVHWIEGNGGTDANDD